MKGIWLSIALIVFLNITLKAQYENAPSCSLSNPHLIEELKTGIVKNISLWSNASSYGIMATSTLAPSGKNPHLSQAVVDNKDLSEEEIEIAEIEASNASEDWDCQYAAHNLSDGQPATAWVEGVEEDGIGEAVISGQLDIKKPVKIWSGYGKSEALFKANNRPAKVKIYLLATNCPLSSQFATNYESLTVIGTKEITLKDLNGYQPLILPEIKRAWKPRTCEYEEENPGTYFIAIEILSVYKGTRYRDTCISEIGN